MSLDVYLTQDVYSANITHNLNNMAEEAGIYEALWRPDEAGYYRAGELIEPLSEGLIKLLADPDHYRAFNPPNGWGSYEGLVKFVTEYIEACKQNRDAKIQVSR